MEKETLKQIVLEQKETFEKEMNFIVRAVLPNIFSSPKIIIITGIRRCGKSTLLRQIAQQYRQYSYFNFEDERLIEFTHSDFNILLEIFLGLDPAVKTFFFDEIQNIPRWEKFARRLFTEGYKLFITGSNARLLSSEIATALTGRNIKLELYPFSFKEYLEYHHFTLKETYTTKDRSILSKYLEEYLAYGGFPEIASSKDYEEVREIYQDIIIKDLITRFSIRDTKDFRGLALYLLSNISQRASFNNLKKLLQFSTTSKVKNYVDFLAEAYLFFMLFKYDYSIKKQIKNDRKIYAVDPGLVNAVSFRFGKEKGKLLENVVFLELRRQKKELYYYQGQHECDFLIKEGTTIVAAIQVTLSLHSPETKERELQGLREAMKAFNLGEGIIITFTEEETITADHKIIYVIPLWKFLLQGLPQIISPA